MKSLSTEDVQAIVKRTFENHVNFRVYRGIVNNNREIVSEAWDTLTLMIRTLRAASNVELTHESSGALAQSIITAIRQEHQR